MSKQWDSVPPNQWHQTYYEVRDGKLFLCHNDNKEQTYNESEIEVDGFLAKHAASTEAPYPEIIAFIKAHRQRA